MSGLKQKIRSWWKSLWLPSGDNQFDPKWGFSGELLWTCLTFLLPLVLILGYIFIPGVSSSCKPFLLSLKAAAEWMFALVAALFRLLFG